MSQIERNMAELSSKAIHTPAVYEEQIFAAEKVMSLQVTPEEAPVPSQNKGEQAASSSSSSSSSVLPLFQPQSDLKPTMLERESSYQEVIHFCQIWENYMASGYGGRDNIPKDMVSVQLQPFINPSW